MKKILLIVTLFQASLSLAVDNNFYTSFKSGASYGQNTGLVNYDSLPGEGGAATLENSDLSSALTSGISVGRYFTNNLRGEFSLDIKITKSSQRPMHRSLLAVTKGALVV